MKYLFLLLIVFLISCSKKINQYKATSSKTAVKTGKWIVEDQYPGQVYKSIGRYKNGDKKGIWKTYLNGKILQKDRYKGSLIMTKIYHPNGKLAQKGQSRIQKDSQSILWFYDGKWIYYDKTGKADHIKIFYKDRPADSVKCNFDNGNCKNIR